MSVHLQTEVHLLRMVHREFKFIGTLIYFDFFALFLLILEDNVKRMDYA